MTNEFEKNQGKIDKLIKRINDTRWNTPASSMNSPEYRKSQHKEFLRVEKLKEKNFEILKKKIRKKRFYFNPIKKSHSIYGGTYYEAPIFQHTSKGLKPVGKAKWNTASTSGEESEVLQQLVRDKILPKEVLAVSRSVNTGSGYYHWDFKDKLGLEIKQLSNQF